jgi:hypothetical protein
MHLVSAPKGLNVSARVFVVLCGLSLFLFSHPIRAFVQIKTAQGQGILLNSRQPIFFNVYEPAPFQTLPLENWIDILHEQYKLWSEASLDVLDFRYLGVTQEEISHLQLTNDPRKEVDSLHTHRAVLKGWSEMLKLSKTAVAVTLIYTQGSTIVDADVVYNHEKFDFCQEAPTCRPGFMHLPSITLHEIGHQLGLDHQDQELSIMSARIGRNTYRSLQPDDVSAIRCLYGEGVLSQTDHHQACLSRQSAPLTPSTPPPSSGSGVGSNPTPMSRPNTGSCGSLVMSDSENRLPAFPPWVLITLLVGLLASFSLRKISP